MSCAVHRMFIVSDAVRPVHVRQCCSRYFFCI